MEKNAQDILNIIAKTLGDNLGNRLTEELANGMFSKIHNIAQQLFPDSTQIEKESTHE